MITIKRPLYPRSQARDIFGYKLWLSCNRKRCRPGNEATSPSHLDVGLGGTGCIGRKLEFRQEALDTLDAALNEQTSCGRGGEGRGGEGRGGEGLSLSRIELNSHSNH